MLLAACNVQTLKTLFSSGKWSPMKLKIVGSLSLGRVVGRTGAQQFLGTSSLVALFCDTIATKRFALPTKGLALFVRSCFIFNKLCCKPRVPFGRVNG